MYPGKRLFELLISILLLIIASPILLISIFLVFLSDFKNPFYFAERVGRSGNSFYMVKIRSMVVDAFKSGVNSTGNADPRITPIGRLIRKFKLDELSQFFNVLLGQMSIVGPRPNTWAWGVEFYSMEEQRLLECRPGITDFASLVFADEGVILENEVNPDLAYNQLIRPWKSRLGLFYIDKSSLGLDLYIVLLTILSLIDRDLMLRALCSKLEALGADDDLVAVSKRAVPLEPAIPPGCHSIFTTDIGS